MPKLEKLRLTCRFRFIVCLTRNSLLVITDSLSSGCFHIILETNRLKMMDLMQMKRVNTLRIHPKYGLEKYLSRHHSSARLTRLCLNISIILKRTSTGLLENASISALTETKA